MSTSLFGDADEHEYLRTSHPALIEAVEESHNICIDFLRIAQSRINVGHDHFVFLLGVACFKEFEEIGLLCGNGYGSGAKKLLRALYERVVTCGYLIRHPEETESFTDYSDVHWHKLLQEARQQDANISISEEAVTRITNRFEEVRTKFEHSKTKSLQRSWTKDSVSTLAAKAVPELRRLLGNAYMAPTFHVHTTYWAISKCADTTPDGQVDLFGRKTEHEMAKDAIGLALILLLQLMIDLNAHFKLGRDEVLKAIGQSVSSLLATSTQ